MSTLLDLIQTKVNYVVQEAIVVIKDIFRKYPNKYESIISTLCENLDTLDEPEARWEDHTPELLNKPLIYLTYGDEQIWNKLSLMVGSCTCSPKP